MNRPPAGRWVQANDWTMLDGRVASSPPRVSVLIVHYEQGPQLARTLHALQRQSYPRECLEIIVVDDGSAAVPHVPDGVRLIRQTRRGARRSAARNRGVAASTGEVLCFLDADTTPEPGYVGALTRLPALAPEAVSVGLRRHAALTATPLTTDIETAGPAHELPAPRWLSDGYARTRDLVDCGPDGFRYVISAVLGTSRWLFDQVGGFDESFTAYGGEDWEWAHRAWLDGAIFAHVPEAVAWHDGPEWSGRDGLEMSRRRRDEKNAEAMRLAGLITVNGHRPHGLLTGRPETMIELDGRFTPATAFVTVDALLAALPRSAVVVPDEVAEIFGDDPRVCSRSEQRSDGFRWPALYLTVHVALQLDSGALTRTCEEVLASDEGVRCLRDDHGELARIESARHRVRVARWGPEAGLISRVASPDWLARLDDPPDVEAYLGGWER